MMRTVFCCRNIFNLFERISASFINDIKCVNSLKRAIPIIISITAAEENFYDLELSLYSLLNQSLMPDRIILWISDEYTMNELPYGITRYIKNGLEIRLVKEIERYTNVIYSLQEFPNAITVVCESGVYYKKDWLKKLYLSYISAPADIHAHIISRIKHNNSAGILSLNISDDFENEESAGFDNFALMSGGILYPPKCFNNEVFRDDIYLSNSIDSELWMWVMSLLSNRKTRLVKSHIRTINCINLFQYLTKQSKKYKNYNNQIKKLLPYYGQNIAIKLRK